MRFRWNSSIKSIYLNSNFLNVKLWYQFLVGSWFEISTTSIFQHFNFTFSVSLSFSIYIVKKRKRNDNKNNNSDGIKQNKLWRRKKENRSARSYGILYHFSFSTSLYSDCSIVSWQKKSTRQLENSNNEKKKQSR